MGAMNLETAVTSKQDPVTLRGATQFDMTAKVSGRTYRIFVFRPPSDPPPSGYPVVVMTDGNMSFPAAATLDGMFALQGGKAALVVGVGYPGDDAFTPFVQRNRDLTPPTPLSGIRPVPGQPPPKLENYGGSQDFYRFLVEELRPAIAEAYTVDPNDQTLYGHSLGGLFVLGMLFAQPGAFRNFVASSPSIWWNKRALLKGEAAFADKIKAGAATPRVLILVGAEEQDPPPTLPPGMTRPQMKRLLGQARMVDNARELAERLSAIKGRPGYRVRFHALDDEDHLTVVPTAISRTLAFALRDDPVKKARKK
jgi:uncharacterized protein